MKHLLALIFLFSTSRAMASPSCEGVFTNAKSSQIQGPIEKSLVRLSRNFQTQFHKDNGASLQMIIDAAERTKFFKDSVHYFRNEKFQVAMFRPQNARSSFIKNGLTNIHQSKKTMATAGERNLSRYMETRINIEAGLLGLSTEDYLRTNLADRPKYALLRMDPRDTRGTHDHFGSMYGEDVFILKKDRIRARTTFSLGDSIDKVSSVYGVDSDFKGFKPRTWDGGLLPWQAREILAIETAYNLKPRDDNEDAPIQILVASEYEQALSKKFHESLDPILSKYTREEVPGFYDKSKKVVVNGAKYIEAQIFGDLRIEDIEAFEFTDTPPSKNFAEFLRMNGVKIFDARSFPIIEYVN